MKFAATTTRLFPILTIVSLTLTGCDDPGLDNLKTYQKTIRDALGESELEKRQEGDEERLYRRDDQTPYSGWFAARWNENDPDVRILAQYKNGSKDGPYIEYDEMLNEKLKGQYKNGKKDGFWTEAGPEEGLLQAGHYKDGRKDGPWTETRFDEDSESGVTETEVNYVNGERMTP